MYIYTLLNLQLQYSFFFICTALIRRYIWQDIALLRDFSGKTYKSHFLEHERRSHLANFKRNPNASNILNNAYFSFEQTYSDISNTQKGQQILSVIKRYFKNTDHFSTIYLYHPFYSRFIFVVNTLHLCSQTKSLLKIKCPTYT